MITLRPINRTPADDESVYHADYISVVNALFCREGYFNLIDDPSIF